MKNEMESYTTYLFLYFNPDPVQNKKEILTSMNTIIQYNFIVSVWRNLLSGSSFT